MRKTFNQSFLSKSLLSSAALVLFCFLNLGFVPSVVATKRPERLEQSAFITEKRQLTFKGPRSGEGYFSADGKKMIFQAERHPGNPFYQIYSLDLESGETNLISTGKGQTTCAWFHPTGKKALYSSTHLDPQFSLKVQAEFNERANPTAAKRYAWSFDEHYDIFEVDLKTKRLKRLTDSQGYDAEASYSPDGEWIVFASNRSGFTPDLSTEEKALFEKDPSSQMEIYKMRVDGTKLQRLTHHLGYDGGPFFSADGSKITWRRFSPDRVSAQIWVMNSDGSDAKQLTHWQAMSWAPYFHPSGDYIIFTSNKLGFDNFELFIVDTLGKKEPVQVTFQNGFDGLPAFHPAGDQLSWTFKDPRTGESQIYLAKWNDENARKALGLPTNPLSLNTLGQGSREQQLRAVVDYLTHPYFAGRMTGSQETEILVKQLAKLFKEFGLQPLPGMEMMIQPFEFVKRIELGGTNSARLAGGFLPTDARELRLGVDFTPVNLSESGEFEEREIVFAGFGILAPALDLQPEYNSFANLDLKDKWVLIFGDIPDLIPVERKIFINRFSHLHHKVSRAASKGAYGVILVNPRSSKSSSLRLDPSSVSKSEIPVIEVSLALAQTLLQRHPVQWSNLANPPGNTQPDTSPATRQSGRSIASITQILRLLDEGQLVHGPLVSPSGEKARFQAKVELRSTKARGLNLVGYIPGPRTSRELILVGAHLDHLGMGEVASSLAAGDARHELHPGADDNASGVAALLLTLSDISKRIRNKEWVPEAHLGFALWTGEELGLLGAHAFLKEFKSFQKKSSRPWKLKAYVNSDMVGKLNEKLIVQGIGSAPEWPMALEKISIQTKLPISLQEDPYSPTDSIAFYLNDVPAINFFTRSHLDYHTPKDTADKLNYPGLARVVDFKSRLTQSLALNLLKLRYQKVERTESPGGMRKMRIFLGTIPDYVEGEMQGLKISGTIKGSPAEKAGLQGGDIIQKLSEQPVRNIQDYMLVLQSLRIGEPVEIEILRQGRVVKAKIVPQPRAN